ncbi:endoribonuclease L-PSP [Moraxella bovoculi]|uniref:Endoribonuclease L-PSP n=1 Tax=Moraxella bovoculi TaxID=386891 RepID=A0AAC8T7I6_9GAMM|nr:RidA family protein [Moraxella bovoculi]AKG06858.1 endoribonuclease L-PSP [Moraxella bovoculi]AKG08847.1 endoribonuclease L-PSP [Moraxella bovoculi]AKG10678.1 endoribonuclease L-PSP [Moraxella bovoculi]AKG12717.1 endoribonuclease L-PSP [Moraxella bovoculi]
MANITKLDGNDTLSEIAIHNGVVYLAGQVPNDDSLDIKGQSREVFANIDAALAKAGSDKSKILSAQVFITDLANFDAFNKEWNQWVKDITPPARATVEAKLVNPNWLVEIMVVAAI